MNLVKLKNGQSVYLNSKNRLPPVDIDLVLLATDPEGNEYFVNTKRLYFVNSYSSKELGFSFSKETKEKIDNLNLKIKRHNWALASTFNVDKHKEMML